MSALVRAAHAGSRALTHPALCTLAFSRSSAACSAPLVAIQQAAVHQHGPTLQPFSSSIPSGVRVHRDVAAAERLPFVASRYYGSEADAPAHQQTDKDSSTSAKSPSQLRPSYMLAHPTYDMSKIEHLQPCHRDPKGVRDWVSYSAVYVARTSFDLITGYSPSKSLNTENWLHRFIFLETVAGVPGMVGAMLRHMVSLRTLKRDHGWIHTLLEEAENERMHLLTFMKLKNPGLGFRLAVLGAQGVFFNAFLAAYIFMPRTCHRFVGYLEEEAVKTYTHALHDIDSGVGDAAAWAGTPAPDIAITYWHLPDDATVRDVIVAVRADEACHAHVNHTLASMAPDQENPFQKGHTALPKNFVEPPDGFDPAYERAPIT